MDEYRTIEIEHLVRTGDECGAQIVLLRNGLIAKIYDPLFYNFHYDYDWAPPKNPKKRNVTLIADNEYIAETAAYLELQKTTGAIGVITPAFHGSWIFNVPVAGRSGSRRVQMILLEHVIGTSMRDMNPQALLDGERENIMAKVIEAESDLVVAGIRHLDFEARNIILSRLTPSSGHRVPANMAPFADPDLRVCIIDFALCVILPNVGDEPSSFQVHNPLFSWGGQPLWSNLGWLPPSEEAEEWMWGLWGEGGKDGKYVAVETDPRSSTVVVKRSSL